MEGAMSVGLSKSSNSRLQIAALEVLAGNAFKSCPCKELASRLIWIWSKTTGKMEDALENPISGGVDDTE